MSELLQQLKKDVPAYRPNEQVRSAFIASEKTFTPLVGPAGVGKTFIAEHVTDLDPSIQLIDTSTNRWRKDSDPNGFRTAKEHITLEGLAEDIRFGRLINYDVILETGTIYATHPEGFRAHHNIGPLTAANLETFIALGTPLHPVYITSPVEMWAHFLKESLGERYDTIATRAPEMIESIEFAQKNLDLFTFIESRSDKGSVDEAAQAIIDLTHNREHTAQTKESAAQSLEAMRLHALSLAA